MLVRLRSKDVDMLSRYRPLFAEHASTHATDHEWSGYGVITWATQSQGGLNSPGWLTVLVRRLAGSRT
eukprot:201657-Pyramimonas_sp.AAC.1